MLVDDDAQTYGMSVPPSCLFCAALVDGQTDRDKTEAKDKERQEIRKIRQSDPRAIQEDPRIPKSYPRRPKNPKSYKKSNHNVQWW